MATNLSRSLLLFGAYSVFRRLSQLHPNSHNVYQIINWKSRRMDDRQYWLLKTEAGEWSWGDQARNGGISQWDGVKNRQAQKYMKAMKAGDLCFFYHSGSKARQIVGVVRVIKEWYTSSDKSPENDGVVDVEAVGEMGRPVDLKEMKEEESLKGFVLFKQPRLSVVPVPNDMWKRICELGGLEESDVS